MEFSSIKRMKLEKPEFSLRIHVSNCSYHPRQDNHCPSSRYNGIHSFSPLYHPYSIVYLQRMVK